MGLTKTVTQIDENYELWTLSNGKELKVRTHNSMMKDIKVNHEKEYVITEGEMRDLIHMLMGEEEAEEKIYINANHGVMEIENFDTNITMTFSEKQ